MFHSKESEQPLDHLVVVQQNIIINIPDGDTREVFDSLWDLQLEVTRKNLSITNRMIAYSFANMATSSSWTITITNFHSLSHNMKCWDSINFLKSNFRKKFIQLGVPLLGWLSQSVEFLVQFGDQMLKSPIFKSFPLCNINHLFQTHIYGCIFNVQEFPP